jgi:lipopolysaccharide/colanic/teichoic acid biosynthesis glycosyltransferase
MKELGEAIADTAIQARSPQRQRFQPLMEIADYGIVVTAHGQGDPRPVHGAPVRRRKPLERIFFAKRRYSTAYLITKRWMDLWVGGLMLLGLLPVLGLIALLLKASGSQVLFSQRRVGKGGQLFECYKFCTMKKNAEDELARLLRESPERRLEWLRTQKLTNDPRVTRLGRFLRLTSLDELPQFMNVLRGEMSLVGPRPILANELAKYGPYADHYLSVKPGLTGLWQINGRNDTTYHRRVALDVAYARNASLGLDFNILMRSFVPLLTARGAR